MKLTWKKGLRNRSPHRLEHKPTKRNVEWTETELKKTMKIHRLNSIEGEIKREKYLRIDNTKLAPQGVAKMIKETFNL